MDTPNHRTHIKLLENINKTINIQITKRTTLRQMIKFKYKELDKEKGRAIVKVTIGDLYIITKAGAIGWIAKELISTYSKYTNKGINEDSLYCKFIEKVYRKGILDGSIDILYQTTNGYDLLKKELELLQEHFGKKNCLNTNNIPYIPKIIRANKGSKWLKQNEYLNFMKLLKNYEY